MNLQIINTDLSLYGIVTGFESVEFTRAFNTKGSFKIKINANSQNAKYIQIDKIVYLDENKIGYIDKVTIDRKSDKAGEYIIAEGVELKDRLNRLIYPDSGLETDSYTGVYLETIVKSLINKNAGYLASSKRQIPNLITAADQNRGDPIDYSARYKDLSTELYSLLSSNEMGLKAAIDFDNTNIIFDVAQGNYLTASEEQAGGIVLSLDTKTALEIVDTDDKLSYKNLSVTVDSNSGSLREVSINGAQPEGYERCEVFTEARDIQNEEELATRGAQKLAEISKTRAITAKANTLGSYQIGDDYDLGDYISVDANGDLYDAQVTKLKYKFSKESVPEIEVVLNFDTDDTLISDISAKHMDYDALVASTDKAGQESYINPASICALYYYVDANTLTSSGSVINYNTKLYDIGNNFNASTKIFTAPVTGLYKVRAKALVQSPTDQGRYSVEIYKSTTRVITSVIYASGTSYCDSFCEGEILLNVGDTLDPKSLFTDTKYILGTAEHSYIQIRLLRDDS